MKARFKLFMFLSVLFIVSCNDEAELNVPVNEIEQPSTELDLFIDRNFVQEYGIAIRYKFDNNFIIIPDGRAIPPKIELVRPTLEFIQEVWIDPYLEIEGGEEFFRRYVPAEIVLLGSGVFNNDGTETQGVADQGAQVTLTGINDINTDENWRIKQLRIIQHEFSHILHRNFGLPDNFETIAPQGYTGPGSWFVLSDQDAIERGFVTPYATSNVNEDFVETIAIYLRDESFEDLYVNQIDTCVTQDCELSNEGRAKIGAKLEMVKRYYLEFAGVDLDELKDAIQEKL